MFWHPPWLTKHHESLRTEDETREKKKKGIVFSNPPHPPVILANMDIFSVSKVRVADLSGQKTQRIAKAGMQTRLGCRQAHAFP